jgi:hypothetical protein
MSMFEKFLHGKYRMEEVDNPECEVAKVLCFPEVIICNI